ncbi:hypothetical protein ACI7RC_10425 [Brevibacillus sp. B_LB10_24]|uniref:hypothetical protein n=1 Tax=Brevibacillus sp. B_LB10_24 TaxID=3380645 RepID=UPI0038BC22A6
MNLKALLPAVVILFAAAGCSPAPDVGHTGTEQHALQETKAPESAFDETEAAEAVLRDHPDFPQPGEVKEIETTTGGEYPGTKVKGTLSTKVEPSQEPDTYIVTLTKQWNFTINDKELIGTWQYEVTPHSVQLIDHEDNTDLIEIVK